MITWTQYLDNILTEAKYSYSSLMIPIQNPLAHKIVLWGDENIKDNNLFVDLNDPSFGREDDPHITILYGIETSNIKQVKSFLKTIKPFEVKLNKVSLFENDNFNVVKIDVSSKELNSIHFKAKFEFDYKEIHKSFIPHITIAYVKKDFGKSLINNNDFENEKILVKSLVFSSKEGIKTTIKLHT